MHSDDLKTEVNNSQESMYFWSQKEANAMKCNGMCHSSCKDIFAWKIKQVFLHWTIKNIASFSYEAVRLCKECNPKIDCPCINLPYSESPKMNDFLLRMLFILKNVGLKFDKASLNTLYNSWINLGYPLSDAELS